MKFMKPLKKMCLFIVLAVVFFFAKGFTAAIVCLIVSGGTVCLYSNALVQMAI